MSDGITTAASMKDWKADVPCCTTRPYDHVHPVKVEEMPGIDDVGAELVAIEEEYAVECTTCGARENQECQTVGGNAVPDGHAARKAFITEMKEKANESETE